MSARIALHVTPKSGRNEICGWRGGELSVRVTAPPEDGKANVAVCKLIAKTLGVPKSAVSVVRGDSSRHKQVEVEGLSEMEAASILGPVEGY